MQKLILILLISFISNACTKEHARTGLTVGSCTQHLIDELKKEKSPRNPRAEVWEFDYNGDKVYYVPPYCCDEPSLLYDKYCNVICEPDGGDSGKGDGKCSDFFTNRTNGSLVWRDTR